MIGTRFIAIVRDGMVVPAGHCPACDSVMDDSGCRLGDDFHVRPGARERTGIARIVEVWCRREPAHPVEPCPCCEREAAR